MTKVELDDRWVMTNIEKMDYAAFMTMQRWQNYFRDQPYMNLQNIEDAFIKILMDGNYQSITSQNDARNLLRELSKTELEAELLKYLVKMVFYKRSINDPSLGKGVAIRLEDVDSTTLISHVENALCNKIEDTIVQFDYNNDQSAPGQVGFLYLQHNADILRQVVRSFVQNRYGQNLIDEVEWFSEQNPYVTKIVDEIDFYALKSEQISGGLNR